MYFRPLPPVLTNFISSTRDATTPMFETHTSRTKKKLPLRRASGSGETEAFSARLALVYV